MDNACPDEPAERRSARSQPTGVPLIAFPPTPRLQSVATAVPPHDLPQDVVAIAARRVLGPRYPAFERLSATFTTSGVERRQSVVPLEWFERDQDWESRNRAYLDGASLLFEAAAERALDRAKWRAEDVDVVVTVSSTGIATPTLEARASQALGFRPDVSRVPLFGLGCAGGVTGLSHAASFARARPGARVLLVSVEACTLSFRADRLEKADIIATVLFGDGAGAACISTDADGPALGTGVEHTWPGTLDIMGWNVDRNALGVVFDRSIPAFVSDHFQVAAADALRASGIARSDLVRPICHPGGAKVVQAIEGALGLEAGELDIERDVLRNHGNMSAPTVLFVLERLLARETLPDGPHVLAALGPGFTASFLPIAREPAMLRSHHDDVAKEGNPEDRKSSGVRMADRSHEDA